MELKRYGEFFCRRESDQDPWEVLTADQLSLTELVDLVAEERIKEMNASSPPRVASEIIRSEHNEALARRLGLNANQLADRLARPDENQGTVTRVPDEEFDAIMRDLGLDPEEAKKRFTGKYWETE